MDACQIDKEGKEIRALWGNVDADLRQDANTAEHVGLIHAIGEAKAGCVFVTDCATISGAWKDGMAKAAGPKRPHGGVWREAAEGIKAG